LIGVLVNNNKLTEEIGRSENHSRKVLETVRLIKETRPNDVRLSDVLSICLRLEPHMNRLESIKITLRRVYEASKSGREDHEVL